jgi:hypothetical protein
MQQSVSAPQSLPTQQAEALKREKFVLYDTKSREDVLQRIIVLKRRAGKYMID